MSFPTSPQSVASGAPRKESVPFRRIASFIDKNYVPAIGTFPTHLFSNIFLDFMLIFIQQFSDVHRFGNDCLFLYYYISQTYHESKSALIKKVLICFFPPDIFHRHTRSSCIYQRAHCPSCCAFSESGTIYFFPFFISCY